MAKKTVTRSANGSPKKKKKVKRRKVNKSQKIRDYKAEHPDEGPTAIATALTKQGIKVVPAQVSNVLSNASKKKGGKKSVKKRGPKPGAKKAAANDKVSIGALIDARQFADKVGGVEAAKQLLNAVEKLG